MTRARDLASGSGIEAGEVLPHIIPDVLYPAVEGKDLDGVAVNTSHGSTYTYGTTHADGRMYYYTDIKGSKPIKDPRIGSHFGSQRHKFKSIQLLEQETATHGANVYSVDGREWVRAVGSWDVINGAHGVFLQKDNAGAADFTNYIEYTGYFNRSNFLAMSYDDTIMNISIDGTVTSDFAGNDTTVNSPLTGRYVDAGSVISLPFTPTLGIHTVRIGSDSNQVLRLFGIELIAQDTTSTANKSKIQIPAQNVVSYGKKFAIPATAQHYDPFNGFTNETDNHNTYIDYATSLGTDRWKNSSNYYRPYNGGRVVKWIASDGTIKTSVNMIPPNAQTTFGVAKDEKGDDSGGNTSAAVANSTYKPTISDQAVDFSLSEVAKSFHYREFGNGSANGGTGATYADASMLNSSDDISYVMDDGLTSLSADDAFISSGYFERVGVDDTMYLTFIGTGCSWNSNANKSQISNLPYGTHILKGKRTSTSSNHGDWTIDGQEFTNATNGHYAVIRDFFDIHQPKMPPIPEDAVVIADYMLMADFVPVGANGIDKISKGSRYVSSSRDFLHDTGNGTIVVTNPGGTIVENRGGLTVYYAGMDQNEEGPELVWFGDAKIVNDLFAVSDSTHRSKQYFDGATTNVTVSSQYSDSGAETTGLPSTSAEAYYVYGTKSTGTMGMQKTKFVANPDDTSNDWLYSSGACVATPIHTSSHYQTFETPFLHELVGGDRNMEQTNLIVTPDGKTWDEVTRDVSYIGNVVVNTNTDQGGSIFDEWRGTVGADVSPLFNKDWAIAYDRIICLKSGMYQINASTMLTTGHHKVFVNTTSGSNYLMQNHDNTGSSSASGSAVYHFQRGDYIYVSGYNSAPNYNSFSIIKI